MWRVSSSEVLSPFAYATVLRRLPRSCECLVACADDVIVGFAVAYRSGPELVILDLQLDRGEPVSRLFEVLHALTAWPSFAGARVIEVDEACAPDVREAAAVLRGGPRAVRGDHGVTELTG